MAQVQLLQHKFFIDNDLNAAGSCFNLYFLADFTSPIRRAGSLL